MKLLGPKIGEWYKDLQSGSEFEVVAWDMESHLVEVQHIDGEVAEYDIASWKQLLLVSIEPAEDWRAPFELDGEDHLDPDLPFHPEDWSGPLNAIEPEYMNGVEDF